MSSRLRALLVGAALLAALAAVPATVFAAGASTLNPLSVEGNFMCTSCHEQLTQVNSPEAIDEKQTVVELIDKGYDLAQIKSAMVEIYGANVLAQPPAKGFNLTIYILPPAVVVAGLALLAVTLPKWRERSRRNVAQAPSTATVTLNAEDQERLNDELERFV